MGALPTAGVRVCVHPLQVRPLPNHTLRAGDEHAVFVVLAFIWCSVLESAEVKAGTPNNKCCMCNILARDLH